jgi:amidase
VRSAADGPLAGLRLAVKDIFDVAGYPSGWGQPLRLAMAGTATSTAPAAQRLLGAGARFVGKTITDELAFSLNGRNAHFGTPRNGGAPDRIPGGSSSGSASAVSCGLADIALGSDTGGSVRGPASYCGLWGLRPTHGAVVDAGCMVLAPSFDTVGWFTREAATLRKVGDLLLPPDTGPALRADRLRPVADMLALLQPEVAAIVMPVLAALGAGEPLSLPGPGLDRLYWVFRRMQAHEAWAEHGGFITAWNPPLGPGVADRFAFGAGIDGAMYADEGSVRADFTAAMSALLADGTVLVLPTMPAAAPLLATPEDALDDFRNRALRFLCVAGLAGLPQVNLPVLRESGAPLGLSLVSARGTDRALLALAEQLANAL